MQIGPFYINIVDFIYFEFMADSKIIFSRVSRYIWVWKLKIDIWVGECGVARYLGLIKYLNLIIKTN